MAQARPSRTALVLSGGGTRGAYEVGVVAGIVDVLGLGPDDAPPFHVFTGTSVGAINAVFLAAHADRGDLAVDELVELWTSLSLGVHARPSLAALRQRALLSIDGIEALVQHHVPWDRLHALIDAGTVHAVAIPALHVATGRTVVFADLAPGVRFEPSRDTMRIGVRDRITLDHVLASAAIPGLFPPRTVDGRLFYDGSLRFNTPLAPAIRMGSERLFVVTPLHHDPPTVAARTLDDLGEEPDVRAPDATFLAGKMLNAILLDPIGHDLDVLERFNVLVDLVQASVDAQGAERIAQATIARRGVPYRHLHTLSVSPSDDIGQLGWEHAVAHRRRLMGQGPMGWLTAALARHPERPPSDLTSYLLFDGAFARTLIDLGRHDAHAREAEVRRFFAR